MKKTFVPPPWEYDEHFDNLTKGIWECTKNVLKYMYVHKKNTFFKTPNYYNVLTEFKIYSVYFTISRISCNM